MKIKGIIWLASVVAKLFQKHQIDYTEVEDIFRNQPKIRRIARGDVVGEDLYSAMSQTDSGRYLIVFFIYKRTQQALIISARNMTSKERRRYGRR